MALYICFSPADLEELAELFQSCSDEALEECLKEVGYEPDSEALEEKAKAQAEADFREEEEARLRNFLEDEAELRKAEQASLEARRALRKALAAEKACQIEVAKAVETAKAEVEEAELAERKLRDRFNLIYG